MLRVECVTTFVNMLQLVVLSISYGLKVNYVRINLCFITELVTCPGSHGCNDDTEVFLYYITYHTRFIPEEVAEVSQIFFLLFPTICY
jgi:hypothetical protein